MAEREYRPPLRAARDVEWGAAPRGVDRQPVSLVEWVDRNVLKANDYNPNRVASPEMRLLKRSILEDGWTQPIVARTNGTIVDGFHRWSLSADPDVSGMTGGLVPVVWLPQSVPLEQQVMSTIRHNRARGEHYVLSMAKIVAELSGRGLSDEEIGERLQMDEEEIVRLRDRGSMRVRHNHEVDGGFVFVDPELDEVEVGESEEFDEAGTRY